MLKKSWKKRQALVDNRRWKLDLRSETLPHGAFTKWLQDEKTDRQDVKVCQTRRSHECGTSQERHKPPHLGAHLDVDLVMSPLPTDGVVPAESHKVELQ